MQLLQVGLSSPHLMRRLRHVRQPVFVRFRSFGLPAAVLVTVSVMPDEMCAAILACNERQVASLSPFEGCSGRAGKTRSPKVQV